MLLQQNPVLVNTKDPFGFTCLALAVINKHKDMVTILIKNNASLEEGTPLHLAIKKRHFEIANILLAHGANVNAIDSQGRTAVHLAVTCNSVQLMELLIQYNVDWQDSRNSRGNGKCICGKIPAGIEVREIAGKIGQFWPKNGPKLVKIWPRICL